MHDITKNRLEYLDYLRGICAFGIMIYHYYIHLIGVPNTTNLLSRFGFYGVSIFYILSGIALTHVYHEKMLFTLRGIGMFLKKRAFRILPLLWAVVVIQSLLLIMLYKKIPYSFYTYFLNFTGLFGFLDPGAGIPNAAWSIGNELTFYIFFPLFVFLYRRYKAYYIAAFTVVMCIYLYYAYWVFEPNHTYDDSVWAKYINPLNQAFLFFSGMLVYLLFYKLKFHRMLNLLILILGVSLFVFFPTDPENRMELISENGRMVFTLSCILVCVSMLKTTYILPNRLHKILKKLGDISYSVYLLHLLVGLTFGKMLVHIFPNSLLFDYVLIFLLSIVTLICSNITYKYIEKKGVLLGSRL